MKLEIDLNNINEHTVNFAGELLRDKFFGEGTRGFYENFELSDKAEKTVSFFGPFERYIGKENVFSAQLKDEKVYASGFWDGDGTLAFFIGDLVIYNDDIKKTYTWKYSSYRDYYNRCDDWNIEL